MLSSVGFFFNDVSSSFAEIVPVYVVILSKSNRI